MYFYSVESFDFFRNFKYLGIKNREEQIDFVLENLDVDTLPITILENTWLQRHNGHVSDHGWGCGYVDLPEGHKSYDVHYDELSDIDVSGGLTYSKMTDDGKWRVGFDTCHTWNTLAVHNEEYVKRETIKLLIELYK